MTLPARVSDLAPFDLLLTVARQGSLGRAAAAHGISQPAASTRIRQLEAQLGLALIESLVLFALVISVLLWTKIGA